jgi:UDP-N-acetylmuramyl pentapeptide phosphotransferase/UDP-N-acetylglucosamine-1-phosphate transferase
MGLVLWAGVSSLLVLLATGDLVAWHRRFLWIVAGVVVVSAAGLFDDFQPDRTRGLVRQLAMLREGRVSSGMVKLVVISAASALAAWALGARGARWVLGALVIAGAANLWNLLDVLPGRAFKYFVPAVAGAALAAGTEEYRTLALIALLDALLLLGLDLMEVAMLGDAGSNVLGFIVGVGLLEALSTTGLAVALAAILALHVLAETVTLSRIIQAVAPLRWFDGLGRVKHVDEQPKQDGGEHSSSS